VLVYASVLRALPPAAPSASLIAPARGVIRRVFKNSGLVLFFTYTMEPQPTGFSAPAFAAPSPKQTKPTILPQNSCQEHTTDNMAAPAPYVKVGGAELMAARWGACG
jgi:hypothetical protein